MVWSVEVSLEVSLVSTYCLAVHNLLFSFFWREQVILIVKNEINCMFDSLETFEILNVFQNALKTRRTVERAHCLVEDSYWEMLNAWD